MVNIKIVCVGKIKEKYHRDEIDEYLKRLRKNFKIDEISEISFLDEEMKHDEMIKKFKEEFNVELTLLKLKDSI